MKINDRLCAAKKKAHLTAVDMGVWFQVHRRTMQTWIEGTEPNHCVHSQLIDGLEKLEKVIKEKRDFPVPLFVNQYKRKAYIEKVRDAVFNRVSSARSTKRRV